MVEINYDRVQPMFKFTNQSGTTLKEVFDRDLLFKIQNSNSFENFKSGSKITLDNAVYEIFRIDITIAENMWGDEGYPSHIVSGFNHFNTVINIILK